MTHSDERANVSGGRARRTRRVAVFLAVAVAVIWAGRLLWLTMLASEGDVPPTSAIPLPTGSEILSEERACASGGCWVEIEVRPPSGKSPQELADDIGATPQLELPGNLIDPRTIWVWADPGGHYLTLRADYFSQEWVP